MRPEPFALQRSPSQDQFPRLSASVHGQRQRNSPGASTAPSQYALQPDIHVQPEWPEQVKFRLQSEWQQRVDGISSPKALALIASLKFGQRWLVPASRLNKVPIPENAGHDTLLPESGKAESGQASWLWPFWLPEWPQCILLEKAKFGHLGPPFCLARSTGDMQPEHVAEPSQVLWWRSPYREHWPRMVDGRTLEVCLRLCKRSDQHQADLL